MNYVFTLCWNLYHEVEQATDSLYRLNNKSDFIHFIVDLGFPIEKDEKPVNIEETILNNSLKLTKLALKYGSNYVRLENKGVSGNWDQMYEILKASYNFSDDDCLICADPDERPKNNGWVKAVGDVLKEPQYAWCSLVMPEHLKVLNPHNTISKPVGKYRVWRVIGNLNWAQGGFSGKFLNECGGVGVLENMPIYGGIEEASIYLMNKLGYTWCMLPDYVVEHTDYEKGTPNASRLLREWKNDIIFNLKEQITFEEWLKKY